LTFNTSAHDLESFTQCRRAYDFTSWNRQRLQKLGPPVAALYKGTGFHLAMHAQRQDKAPLVELDAWCNEQQDSYVKKYIEAVGVSPSDEEFEVFENARHTLIAVVDNYFNFYGWDNPLHKEQMEYIKTTDEYPDATELNFRVGIPGFEDTRYIGTIDALAVDHRNGDIYVVDHKTYSRTPEYEIVLMSYQFMGYVWAAKKLFPKYKIAGVIYDGVMMKEPERPRLLKNKTMSQAWIDTTEALYRETLQHEGLDQGPYHDFLMRLRARDASGDGPFYRRWIFRYPEHAIREFEHNLTDRVTEMTNPALKIYPNFGFSCRFCRVKDLCHATQFGEDVESIKARTYRVAEGSYHPSTQAVHDALSMEME